MNGDQPDKLSERSEFLSGRHSSVRRRKPAKGGQDGRGRRPWGADPLGEQGVGRGAGAAGPATLFWKLAYN